MAWAVAIRALPCFCGSSDPWDHPRNSTSADTITTPPPQTTASSNLTHLEKAEEWCAHQLPQHGVQLFIQLRGRSV